MNSNASELPASDLPSVTNDQVERPEPNSVQDGADSSLGSDTLPAAIATGHNAFQLPENPDSDEFQVEIQALKDHFKSRTEYNFMVCDELAQRGQVPNGRSVLMAGRWGNPASVSQDVKLWFSSLAKRLSNLRANIPDVARLKANELVEQLWILAVKASAEPAQNEANALRKALDELQTVLDESMTSANETIEELSSQVEVLISQVKAGAEETLLAQKRGEDLTAEVTLLRQSISTAALERKQAEREQAQQIENFKNQADRDKETVRLAHQSLVASLQAAIQSERDRFDAATRAHALALDQFRQDLRSSNERADLAGQAVAQARNVTDSLRDQLATQAVEKARLEQRLVGFEAKVSELERTILQFSRGETVAVKNKKS